MRAPQPEPEHADLTPADPCDHTEGCITCGDIALPRRVLRVDRGSELALCADESGRRETVDVGLIPDAAAGEWLLVHAGTAIGRSEEPPA